MDQPALFLDAPARSASSAEWEEIAAPGASIWLKRAVFPPEMASRLLRRLIDVVPWRRDKIRMFGKEHELPRLQQWFGDPEQVYVWSGIEMRPLAWTSELDEVRAVVERATRRRFNTVLLNYYRDGNDTVSWHADDEPGLGRAPFIASLSLGAERDFQLRSQREDPQREDPRSKITVNLPHGSLLVMGGETQANWEHALPRRKRVTEPRVNLTFREFVEPPPMPNRSLRTRPSPASSTIAR